MAWGMVAAVSECSERVDMGSGVLADSRAYLLVFCGNLLLQHGADAEASAVQDSDHRPCRVWGGAGANRVAAVRSCSAGAGQRHFLVLGEGCGIYVPVYLVSWHVPSLPF